MAQGFKPVRDCDENYLEEVIFPSAHGTEHSWVEFKGSGLADDLNKLRDEMSKQLSAFGNHEEGGYVILGVREDKDAGTLEIDGGVPMKVGNSKTEEWLAQILPRQTAEQTTRLDIYSIHSGKGKSRIQKDRVVLVIEIPPHEKAPVQATFDKRFYLRIAGTSVPMDKQQIWDIANRQKHPLVTVEHVRLDREHESASDLSYFLWVRLANQGKIMARFLGIAIVVPRGAHLQPMSQHLCSRPLGKTVTLYKGYVAQLDGLLFPGDRREYSLCRLVVPRDLISLNSPRESLRQFDNIGFAVYADSAPPQSRQFVLSEMEDLKTDIVNVRARERDHPPGFWDASHGDPDFRVEDCL